MLPSGFGGIVGFPGIAGFGGRDVAVEVGAGGDSLEGLAGRIEGLAGRRDGLVGTVGLGAITGFGGAVGEMGEVTPTLAAVVPAVRFDRDAPLPGRILSPGACVGGGRAGGGAGF